MALTLTALPESVLLNILTYLNAVDLYNIASLHSRFETLIEDKSLWKHIDLGPTPLSPQSVRKFIRFFGAQTCSITIVGFVKSTVWRNPKSSQCLSDAFLLSLKRNCPNLEELKLVRCYIDSSNTKFSSLPSSLKRLSLTGSVIVNLPYIRSRSNSPFFRIEKAFPILEEIDVTFCNSWFTAFDMSIIMKASNSLKMIRYENCIYSHNEENGWVKKKK